jgi:hypothetical protein
MAPPAITPGPADVSGRRDHFPAPDTCLRSFRHSDVKATRPLVRMAAIRSCVPE